MSENYTLINWQNGEITQPAVVEIDGVDYQVQPAIETGNTPINADNLNHMDNGIRNATLKLNDKIETATVQLIAVTDTAPSECAENDKYYNTNTNLIYTATGTDTWGVTGETPSQLYLYMDISDEKLYYYDGNTFSSYGGGTGGTGGETLPVGSQIGFDGSVSDIPVGWQQVPDNQIVLYNDTTGTGVTGLNSITLSDSISNYSRIKLVIDTSRDGSSKYAYNIIKEFNINSTLTQFSESVCYDKILWFTFSISNNTLTITKNRLTEMAGTMSEGDYIYITKIIGYKE